MDGIFRAEAVVDGIGVSIKLWEKGIKIDFFVALGF
jgi:hypothetical protein